MLSRATFFVILFAVTTALAVFAMQPGLDLRGASGFIRPFHYGTAAAAVFLTILFLVMLAIVIPRFEDYREVMAAVFIVGFLLVWMSLTPLADKLGVRWERSEFATTVVGDTGYGYFYYEDSGMGNRPTPFYGHLLAAALLGPLRLVALLTPLVIFAFYPKRSHERWPAHSHPNPLSTEP